ncbi:MAG: methylated-DNA--[protein]-cysteine S-methyltransferase [Acidobacteria bacterium]|jgi:methylated-DNA-[protein]-cysteine S-methyltransferase|nr:methylated-DNA--[protein]-cysteine S-methyltransferase [Acidobacteriota bacterium]
MSLVLMQRVISSPIGPLLIFVSEKGLCSVEFYYLERRVLLQKRLDKWLSKPKLMDGENGITGLTVDWLEKYFRGDLSSLEIPPLDIRGSDFELQTWKELLKIPFGRTITYGQLADRIGKPKGARAVGGCVGRNPVAIIIPCHRVIGSNGTLTGFGGGLENKKWLLDHERHFAQS